MSDDGDDKPYEVGYGKPPKGSQFKPGESGNPKGRKARGTTVKAKLQEKLHQKVKLSDGTTSTPMDMIVARALHEIAAGKLGKWIPTLGFLSEFDPKQKFKPTPKDQERLNKLISDAIRQDKSNADE